MDRWKNIQSLEASSSYRHLVACVCLPSSVFVYVNDLYILRVFFLVYSLPLLSTTTPVTLNLYIFKNNFIYFNGTSLCMSYVSLMCIRPLWSEKHAVTVIVFYCLMFKRILSTKYPRML